MILIHGINDNILIPRLSYLGVYQYEEKRDLFKEISNVFGLEPNKKN